MNGELKWFLLLFLGLWVGWMMTGGIDRKEYNRARPFIEEPDPLDSGKVYTLEELRERNRQ